MFNKEKDNDFKWLFTHENSLLNFSVHIFKEFYNFTLFVVLTAQMHFDRLGPYTNHKGINKCRCKVALSTSHRCSPMAVALIPGCTTKIRCALYQYKNIYSNSKSKTRRYSFKFSQYLRRDEVQIRHKNNSTPSLHRHKIGL